MLCDFLHVAIDAHNVDVRYRSQSVISALHYAMWTTQVVRMIHVSMSFNHFNYIDINRTVDSFYHGVIICSSLENDVLDVDPLRHRQRLASDVKSSVERAENHRWCDHVYDFHV